MRWTKGAFIIAPLWDLDRGRGRRRHGLLRAHRERPSRRRTAKKRDELSTFHVLSKSLGPFHVAQSIAHRGKAMWGSDSFHPQAGLPPFGRGGAGMSGVSQTSR